MVQGDDKLQFPVLNNLGFEIWKSKEAKQSAEEAPTLGDPERRGVLMESVGARITSYNVCYTKLLRYAAENIFADEFLNINRGFGFNNCISYNFV